MRPCHRSNAALAGGAVLCDPGGPNVARLQILWHREPTGRYAARTRDSTTGIQGGDRQQPRSGRRGGSAHGGAGVQAVGVGQLPAEALQDLQHLRAVRRMDVAGQRPPAERVRGVLALPEPGAVRPGQPAAERRRAGGPRLGSASTPEATQDLQPLHRPRAAHHPQLVWEDHQERVEGNVWQPFQMQQTAAGVKDRI